LRHGEVLVFARFLAASDRDLTELSTLLSEDERERADRFVFARHRREFTIARAVLRLLLARIVGAQARELAFIYGAKGKPALDPRVPRSSSVRFNVSHSGELALYAVALDREVGVDVERRRDDIDCDGLAARFFSRTEKAELLALSAHERLDAFFRCWTRKEALIKATGAGLSMSLDAFDVTLKPGDAPRVLGMRQGGAEAMRWSLCDLPVDPAYAAALAVESGDARARCWSVGELGDRLRDAL
jgi:4'-phosphopantetheinyl transferase